MTWTIYGKDGKAKWEAEALDYDGEWMGENAVSVKVTSWEPVDFATGDYVTYRGETFRLNEVPVEKSGATGTAGDAYTYNLRFVGPMDELTRCDFLDVTDAEDDFFGMPEFTFFCETINAFAERLQANLDRLYKAAEKWTVKVGNADGSKTGVTVSVQKQTCWEMLTTVYDTFGVTFEVRGRTVTLAPEKVELGKMFRYGRNGGLWKLTRETEDGQKIVTRLRAYGNTTNMPLHYYAEVGQEESGYHIEMPIESVAFSVGPDGMGHIDGVGLGLPATYTAEDGAESVTVEINGKTFTSTLVPGVTTYENITLAGTKEEVGWIKTGMKVRFVSGIIESRTDSAYRVYESSPSVSYPAGLPANRLMLPGFPDETTDPYIDAENIDELGVREGSVYFDGQDETEDIYPSMEGMTADDLRAAGYVIEMPPGANGNLDEVWAADVPGDDGRADAEGKPVSGVTTFQITLKDIGFDINDYAADDGSTPKISLKSGGCGGRDFEISKAETGDTYGLRILTCKRTYDENIGLFFPNGAYGVASGDKFVLTDIRMPKPYIDAASERLLTFATEYLKKNCKPRETYVPSLDEIGMAREAQEAKSAGRESLHDRIREGVLLQFSDDDLEIDGNVYIEHLTIKEDGSEVPTYDVTLKEEKTPGFIERIVDSVKLASGSGTSGGGGYSAAQIGNIVRSYGDGRYLRKDAEDTAKGRLRFEKGYMVGLQAVSSYGMDGNGAVFASGITNTGGMTSNDFMAGVLGAGYSLVRDDGSGQSYLEIDKLMVRARAFFTELEIRKVTYSGGNFIFSPAGITFSRVVEREADYQCYFTTDDGEKATENMFREGDQVLCQTFNIKAGVYENVGNKRYWRLVTSVGDDWIALSKADCETGSDVPAAGDEVCVLGSRSVADRRNAIVISVVGEGSPSIVQYADISGYMLTGKAKTVISPNGNVFQGTLKVETGETVEELMEGVVNDLDVFKQETEVQLNVMNDRIEEIAKSATYFPTNLIPSPDRRFLTGLHRDTGDYGEMTVDGWKRFNTNNGSINVRNEDTVTLSPNQEYTVSIYVRAAGNMTSQGMEMGLYSVQERYAVTAIPEVNVVAEEEDYTEYRIHAVLTAPNDGGSQYWQMMINGVSPQSTVVDFRFPQIQPGPFLTEWVGDERDTAESIQRNEASLTVMDEAIKGKVSQTTYDEQMNVIDERFSEVTQTADGLEVRVQATEKGLAELNVTASGLQSDVTDLEGRVSTVEQTAAGLTVTVTGLRTDFNSLSSTFTQFEQTAEAFKMRVYDTNTTANLIDYSSMERNDTGAWTRNGKLNSLEFYDPTKIEEPLVDEKCFYVVTGTGADGAGIWRKATPANRLKKGDIVTVQMEFANYQNVGFIKWGFEGGVEVEPDAEGHDVPNVRENFYGAETRVFVRRTKTQRLTTDDPAFVIYRDDHDDPNLSALMVKFFVRHVKAEYGTEATDWEPSYNDFGQGVQATGIDITNRRIVLTADTFLVQSNTGEPVAVFDGTGDVPVLKAQYIDAANITVGSISGCQGTFSRITSTNGQMALDGDSIRYNLSDTFYTIKSGIGANAWLYPSTSGNTYIPFGIDVTAKKNGTVFIPVGMQVSAGYEDNLTTTPGQPAAIKLQKGALFGLKLKTRQATSAITLTEDDNIVITSGRSSFNVELPNFPYLEGGAFNHEGHVITLLNLSTAACGVTGGSYAKIAVWNEFTGFNMVSSLRADAGNMLFLVFNKTLSEQESIGVWIGMQIQTK